MKNNLTLFLIIAFLIFYCSLTFVHAGAPADTPQCRIQGTINYFEFKDEYRHNYSEDLFGNAAYEGPDYLLPRFVLNITITNVSFVQRQGDFSYCKQLYPIATDQLIYITNDTYVPGDDFIFNSTIQGIVDSYFSSYFISYSVQTILPPPSCKEYYWYDTERLNCDKKAFCGMFMYQGLRTFETQEACELSLNASLSNERNTTSVNKLCAQEGQFCGGIAGVACCEGSSCNLTGTYPDSGGSCILEKSGSWRDKVTWKSTGLFLLAVFLIIIGFKIAKWIMWILGLLAVFGAFYFIFIR